jgi:phenylacetate-CoA ligase
MMFRNDLVTDFQAVLQADGQTGREILKLLIEVKRDCDGSAVCAQVATTVKNTFEVTPSVEILALGTLASEFERSLKAPRFVDRRQ